MSTMCVTSSMALISKTRTYVTATESGRHIVGYQNEARSLAGPNCMFLNFPGSDLSMVNGPQRTTSLMDSITAELSYLEPAMERRGRSASYGSRGIRIQEYGDYTVLLADGPDDILSKLGEVRADRRPAYTRDLQEMIGFYMSFYPKQSFVLACFNDRVKPEHPIVVSYDPNEPDYLVAPGLDGHDGAPPVIGAPVRRDFRVAFGIEGMDLPHSVYYDEPVNGRPWAPASVAGFVDNRRTGPNGDYIVRVEDVAAGKTGRELAAALIDPT